MKTDKRRTKARQSTQDLVFRRHYPIVLAALKAARAAFTFQINIIETEMGEEGRKRWSRPDPLPTLAEVYAATSVVRQIDAALCEAPASPAEARHE